jgi:hypothetical protein
VIFREGLCSARDFRPKGTSSRKAAGNALSKLGAIAEIHNKSSCLFANLGLTAAAPKACYKMATLRRKMAAI